MSTAPRGPHEPLDRDRGRPGGVGPASLAVLAAAVVLIVVLRAAAGPDGERRQAGRVPEAPRAQGAGPSLVVTGTRAVGTGLRVIGGVPGRGFTVADGRGQAEYVALRRGVAEPPLDAVVDLRAIVRPAPANPQAALGLDTRFAALVRARGRYLETTEVDVR